MTTSTRPSMLAEAAALTAALDRRRSVPAAQQPPMLAYAEILAPDGAVHLLGHGDIIGRLWTAALVIEDPRISEAHAFLSLRGATLRLLALRGRFSLDGQPAADLPLVAGQAITLAEGITIHVLRLCVPSTVLALQAPGLPAQILQGVCSVVAQPTPMLVSGLRPDAIHWLWNDGRQWLRGAAGEATTVVSSGELLRVANVAFAVVAVAVEPQSGETLLDHHGDAPLHLVVRYDTVHIQRDGRTVLALEGIGARLVTELALVQGPVGWRVLAGELWRDGGDAQQQRQRLDVVLTRLRARLRSGGVRADLVRSTGTGHIELSLHRFDTWQDAA